MDNSKIFEDICKKSVEIQLQYFLNRFILELGDLWKQAIRLSRLFVQENDIDNVAKFYQIHKYIKDVKLEYIKRDFEKIWETNNISFFEYLFIHYKYLIAKNIATKRQILDIFFSIPENINTDLKSEINKLISTIMEAKKESHYTKLKMEKVAIDRLDNIIDNYTLNKSKKLAMKITSIEIKEDNYEKLNKIEKKYYLEISLKDGDTHLCEPKTTPFNKEQKYGQLIFNYYVKFPISYNDITKNTVVHFEVKGNKKTFTEKNKEIKKSVFYSAQCKVFENEETISGRRQIVLIKNEQKNVEQTLCEDSIDERILNFEEQRTANEPTEVDWLEDLTINFIKERKIYNKNSSKKKLFLHVLFPSNGLGSHPTRNVSFVPNPVQITTDKDFSVLVDDKILDIFGVPNPKYEPFDNFMSYIEGDSVQQRDKKVLEAIMNYPDTRQLTNREVRIVRKYQKYLKNNKQGLVKYLKTVDWNSDIKIRNSVFIMQSWYCDLSQAFALLSDDFNYVVRCFAVSKLRTLLTEQSFIINMILLVQCLAFELKDKSYENFNKSIFDFELTFDTSVENPLASFLMEKASQTAELSNYFKWALAIDPEFKNLSNQFTSILGPEIKKEIQDQENYFNELIKLTLEPELKKEACASSKEKHEKITKLLKTEYQHLLKPPSVISLPYDYNIKIVGLSEKCRVFNSATRPVCFEFILQNGEIYRMIFKAGDDVRQDQFVLQMITLMDSILKNSGYDLCLRPYKTLALTHNPLSQENDCGIIECVPDSTCVEDVINVEKKSLSQFYRDYYLKNADKMNGVTETEFMDKAKVNFYKSLAGMSVLTYILGIGDRHLNNLMVTMDGKFFHIDFGYVWGSQPDYKGNQPQLRLEKSFMDFIDGEYQVKFFQTCYEAFKILRDNKSMLINFTYLMKNSEIGEAKTGDISFAHLHVEKKLVIDRSENEAIHVLHEEIKNGLGSYVQLVSDLIHTYKLKYF